MNFQRVEHLFRSPKLHSVVQEAIAFFDGTPAKALFPLIRFTGAGVF